MTPVPTEIISQEEIDRARLWLQWGHMTLTHPFGGLSSYSGDRDEIFYPFTISVPDIVAIEILPVMPEREDTSQKLQEEMMRLQIELGKLHLKQHREGDKWKGDDDFNPQVY